MELGLALCGGGSLGSYEYGAIKAFRELGLTFSVVTGTSIGALNGSLVAANRFDRLQKVWESVTIDDVIKDGFDFGLPIKATFSLNPKSKFQKFVRSYLKDGLGADIEPLKKLIAENIEGIDFSSIPTKMGIVTCTYPGIVEKRILLSELKPAEYADYLLASCSCFPAFPVHRIGKQGYIDGGWKNNLPIDYCLQLGADKVIAIYLQSFPEAQRKEYWKLPNVRVLKPSFPQGNMLSFDKSLLDKNMKMGYYDAMTNFGPMKGDKYCFKPNKALSELAMVHASIASSYSVPNTIKAMNKLFSEASREFSRGEEYFFLLNLERLASLFEINPYDVYGVEQMGKIILAKAALYEGPIEGADGKRKRYLRRLFWGRAPVHPASLESFMDRILVETLFRH